MDGQITGSGNIVYMMQPAVCSEVGRRKKEQKTKNTKQANTKKKKHSNIQKYFGFTLLLSLVHLGTLWRPFLQPLECLLKMVYLSCGAISDSLGNTAGSLSFWIVFDSWLSFFKLSVRRATVSSTVWSLFLCLYFCLEDILHGTFLEELLVDGHRSFQNTTVGNIP